MIKLHQGDCLEVMDKLIEQGVKVDMILTDPPYGTTACKWDSVIPFDEMWERLNKLIKPNGIIALFDSEPFSSALRMSNIKNYKYDWIWKKTKYSNFLCLKFMPAKNYENIIIFYKKKPTYNPQMIEGKPYIDKRIKESQGRQQKYGTKKRPIFDNKGLRYPNMIIEFSNPNNKTVHPTQKPVALLEYLIKTYTNENELVLDFTMGSGSTGVACKNLNRSFIGIELDEEYFKIAEDRIDKANYNLFNMEE